MEEGLTENKNDDHDDSEQTSAPEPLPKMTSSHNQEHSATTLDGDKKTETDNEFRVSTGTYSVSVMYCFRYRLQQSTQLPLKSWTPGIPPTTTSPPSTPAPFQSSESNHNSSQNTDMKREKENCHYAK